MNEVIIGVAVWVIGLCIGSFLNVVIYRLPLGLSVREPTWSFCPYCKTTLAWYDNLPVLGWILLRGRCRYCKEPISMQYPLVEAITGLLFVLVYHLLSVAHARVGTAALEWPADVPLLLAWLVLAAAMLVVSVMDLLSYYIDSFVTNVAVALGVLLMAVWPRPAFLTPASESPLGAAAVAVFFTSGLWLWWTERRAVQAAASAAQAPHSAESVESEPPTVAIAPPPVAAATSAAILLCAMALALLIVGGQSGAGNWPNYLVAAIFAIIFAAMVRTSAHPRLADEEVHGEIEEEAPQARRNTLAELLWLCPPIAAGGLTYAFLSFSPAAANAWHTAVHWSPGGGLVPLAGAVFAMHGAMVAAAAGWIVRILFTLVFGREAFGLGDIYILAAAGACAGWDIALLGFLLSVGIALLAWIISLFSKRSVMIAFGPPLALGFVLALWWNVPAAAHAAFMRHEYWPVIAAAPGMFVGLFIASAIIAVTLSRLIRRMVEPADSHSANPPNEA